MFLDGRIHVDPAEVKRREEAGRAAERQRIAERHTAFEAAEAAARAAGAVIDRQLRTLIRHAVALAFEAPRIQIMWALPGSRTRRLLDSVGAALAHFRTSEVNAPPIQDTGTYVGALHEIGHLRADRRGHKVDGEATAWAWARAHALVWDAACNDVLAESLGSYINGADKPVDVPAVHRAEQNIRFPEKALTEIDLEQFEDRIFIEEHGAWPCAARLRTGCDGLRLAQEINSSGRYVCRECAREQGIIAARAQVRKQREAEAIERERQAAEQQRRLDAAVEAAIRFRWGVGR